MMHSFFVIYDSIFVFHLLSSCCLNTFQEPTDADVVLLVDEPVIFLVNYFLELWWDFYFCPSWTSTTSLVTFASPYLLTTWSRVLEKLTDSQVVKKFPTFYGTWIFITAFTSAPHLSLSWASLIQSILPHPTSLRPILIFWRRNYFFKF